MRARVPGSSANLGPGFDTLGVALALYTEVSVKPADALALTVAGEGADLSADAQHLAVQIVRSVLGHDRVTMTVTSEIPVSRGLGSSAALAVAAAAAAGLHDTMELIALVARLEGHGDNAAASVLGGLVTASVQEDDVSAHALVLDPDLRFVAIVPDRELRTAEAREVLTVLVPRDDAVFNLGRLGALIAGLADHRFLRPSAGRDRLHQQQRTPLFPESMALLDALVDGGALMSCWSGAGPTLLGVCRRGESTSVAEAARSAMVSLGVEGRVLPLEADRTGLVVTER